MKRYVEKWRNDYNFKTIINSTASFFITTAFALFNGYLGLCYLSVWNIGIAIYYLLIALIRGLIILTEKRNVKREKAKAQMHRKRMFWFTAIILLLMNLALAVPIMLMVYNQRPVNMGSIPSITIATYTTYKVTMASINIKRMSRSSNILVRELRTMNFIDALVSVLTLQNTLIIVNSGESSYDMFILSAISSAAILLVIVLISVRFVVKELKRHTK